MMRGHILGLEMDFRHAAIVAGEQPIKNFRQPDARPPIDAAHDTEINSGAVPVWRDEQIALVHVGMEASIRNRLPQESVHRSEERRGGQESVSTCRCRWSADYEKKKKNK